MAQQSWFYKENNMSTWNVKNLPTVEKINGEGYSPFSMRNKLINGDKRINQRAYADGVLADGVYGYDRWKGANSDANIEQVIEQQNIRSGTYTISFTGGGTATVDGTSGLSSGDNVTLTVTGNISVIVPKGASDIQLEEGLIATPFEQRPIGMELSLCQRYYEKGSLITGTANAYTTTLVSCQSVSINTKRIIPTVTLSEITLGNFTYSSTASINPTVDTFSPRFSVSSTTDGRGGYCSLNWISDAEL